MYPKLFAQLITGQLKKRECTHIMNILRLLWNILRALSGLQERWEPQQVRHLVLPLGLLHALHPRLAPEAGGQGEVQHWGEEHQNIKQCQNFSRKFRIHSLTINSMNRDFRWIYASHFWERENINLSYYNASFYW